MSNIPLPSSWVHARISEIAAVNPTLDKSEIADDLEVSFVPMPAVEQLTGRITVSKTRPLSEVKKGFTPFLEGDVLFAKITPCMENGKMAVAPALKNGYGFGSTEFHVLRPFSGISAKYIYYFVSSQGFRYAAEHKMSGAVGQRRVTTTYISAQQIPVPPSREQRRIVAKIEELFSELDKGVEALTTAREQLKVYCKTLLDQAASGDLLVARGVQKGRFNEDTWRSLSEVVSSLGQGWSPRCLNHPSPSEELWAVITTTAIQHGSFGDQENKQLPDELEPRTHLVIQPGDILVTRAGPRKRVGVACLVRRSRSRLLVCDKAYRLRVKEKELLPEWMELTLNSPRILQSVEELKTGISDSGVNLTQDRFLGLRVPVPSLKAQRETLSIVDAAMSHATNLAGQIDSALIQVDALRQSILKQAFAGQLVAQNPADEPASVLLERIRAERTKTDAKKPGRKTKSTGTSKAGKRATA
jgi:type I restriction enzyme S subunit